MSTTTNGPELSITRIFDAPREDVFKAWTEGIGTWCAPHGFTIPFSEGDLRPGGKWKSAMESEDTGLLNLGGEYREIASPGLLSFTHIWTDDVPPHETLVTVRLFEEGCKTRMEFHQGVFKSEESRDGHRGGWSECFDRLDQHLAIR